MKRPRAPLFLAQQPTTATSPKHVGERRRVQLTFERLKVMRELYERLKAAE